MRWPARGKKDFLVRIIVAVGKDAYTVFVSPDNTEAKIGIPLNLVNVLIVCRAVDIKTFCPTSSYFSSFLFRVNPIRWKLVAVVPCFVTMPPRRKPINTI